MHAYFVSHNDLKKTDRQTNTHKPTLSLRVSLTLSLPFCQGEEWEKEERGRGRRSKTEESDLNFFPTVGDTETSY